MQKQLKQVEEFHKLFKIPNKYQPSLIDENNALLRYKLMREENEEYLEASQNKSLTDIADALGDMLYILCGTILSHGMQNIIEKVFDEIQASNMSKLGENGKPLYREDGKVLKGPNYFKPNIEEILKSD